MNGAANRVPNGSGNVTMQNGHLSRPSSAASNHQYGGSQQHHQHQQQQQQPHHQQQQQQQLGLGLPPPPLPPSSQQGLSPSQGAPLQAHGAQFASASEGTPRPFAGSGPPPVSSATSTPRQLAAHLGGSAEVSGPTPPLPPTTTAAAAAASSALPNGLSLPPPGASHHQNAAKGQPDPASQIDVTDDDVFAGLDFDSFLNENMFAEDGPSS